MSEATDAQMQTFADGRIRPRAEQLRALINAFLDDKAELDDVYARATGQSRWNDNRGDAPAHMLQAGNAASPDDFLNYNALADAFLGIIGGIGNDTTNAATLRANYAVLRRACVKPL